MTYPYPDDPLGGLDPTDEERHAYLEALDEAGAEEDPGEGPWHDFNTATASMDATARRDARRDAQRAAEDIEDALERRPSAETRIERAMDRIGSGTYTEPAPPQQPGPARDAYGQFASACGPLDEHTGTCASRYHAADCPATIAGTAAVESVTSAEAWNRTLRGHPFDPGVLGFAEPAGPPGGTDTWAGLLQPPGGPDPGLHERMLAVLADAEQAAEAGPEPFPREQYPDTSSLREAMGL